MIKRQLTALLESRLKDRKALVVLGPRQTGKTTLLNDLLHDKEQVLYLNADDPTYGSNWSVSQQKDGGT